MTMKVGSILLIVACLYALHPAGSSEEPLESESAFPTLAWASNHTHYPFSEFSPMVNNGMVCRYNNRGLALLDIETGEEIWNERLITNMVPFIDCEHVYYVDKMLFGGFSKLNCYSTTENAMVWTSRIPGRPTFFPVVVDEKMVLTTGAHSEIVGHDPIQETCVICVNKYTGERYWKFEGEGKMNCAPCVADNTVYAASSEGTLYSMDLESGDLLWEYETGTSLNLAKTPTVYEDRVYFVCDSLYCLDLNGTVLWESPLQFNQKVWASNHRLYTIEGDDAVGVDMETGEILWRVPIDNYFFTTSLQGWNHIFFGSEEMVYCVSREGEVLWEYTIQEHDDFFIYSTPVLYDGYLVMGTQLGHVYTFRLPGEWCYQEAEAMYEDGNHDLARGFYTQALDHYRQKGDNTRIEHITQRLVEIGPEPDTCREWRAHEVREKSSLYGGLGIWVGILVGVFMWMKVFRNI